MFISINSNTTFERRQDVKHVQQARENLRNIYQKFVRNNMVKEDRFKDALILDRTGEKFIPVNDMEKEHIIMHPELKKQYETNLASDGKIAAMPLEEVQVLLKNAEIALKNKLKLVYEAYQEKKNPLTPIQRDLLKKMRHYIESQSLISIPQR